MLYGVLDTGVGGKNVMVPWTAFQVQKKAGEDHYCFTLNKTQDQLANAPTFDKNHWPDFADSGWQQRVYDFFGVRMAARPGHQER